MQWSDLEAKFTGLVEPIIGKSAASTVFSNLRTFGNGGELNPVFGNIRPMN